MTTKINQLIFSRSKTSTCLFGHDIKVIDLHGVRKIASETGTSLLDIEIACLQHSVIPLRYIHNIGSIGIDGQIKLLHSTVAVCGAGGLGDTGCELLARQGVGHLIIIDRDKFDETNLNRQIMAGEEDIGKYKVTVTASRIAKINAAVRLTIIDESIDVINIYEMLGKADVVLDGLDNFAARRIVAAACCDLNIPFIHGAVAGFYGQIMTIFPGDRGTDIVCGSSTSAETTGIEAITGNLPAIPSAVAAWQVQEVIKIITGIGHPIRHRLLLLDFENNKVDDLPLSEAQ